MWHIDKNGKVTRCFAFFRKCPREQHFHTEQEGVDYIKEYESNRINYPFIKNDKVLDPNNKVCYYTELIKGERMKLEDGEGNHVGRFNTADLVYLGQLDSKAINNLRPKLEKGIENRNYPAYNLARFLDVVEADTPTFNALISFWEQQNPNTPLKLYERSEHIENPKEIIEILKNDLINEGLKVNLSTKEIVEMMGFTVTEYKHPYSSATVTVMQYQYDRNFEDNFFDEVKEERQKFLNTAKGSAVEKVKAMKKRKETREKLRQEVLKPFEKW